MGATYAMPGPWPGAVPGWRSGKDAIGGRGRGRMAMNEDADAGEGRRHRHGPRGRRGGGPGFGGGFGPMGRGPRVGRGDVRAAVLALLAEEPMHGYQIISELTERSGGAWRPSPGSVYPTLSQLTDEGLVRAEETDGRRVFHLTDAGRAVVAERGSDTRAPWDAVHEELGVRELRDLAFSLAGAVRQVAVAGTDAQRAAAAAALSEARRRIYRILAEDDEAQPGPGAPTDAS